VAEIEIIFSCSGIYKNQHTGLYKVLTYGISCIFTSIYVIIY